MSYDDLVLHALGEERRALATRQTRAAIRSNTAALQLVDEDDLMEVAAPPPKTGRRPPHSAPTAALAVARQPLKHHSPKSGKPSASRNKAPASDRAAPGDRAMEPTKYRTPEGYVVPFGIMNQRRRADPPLCFCCGQPGHASALHEGRYHCGHGAEAHRGSCPGRTGGGISWVNRGCFSD